MDYRKREQKHRFNLFEKELKCLIEHYSIDEHSNMSSIKITKFILGSLKELSNPEKWVLPNNNKKDFDELEEGDEISFQKIHPCRKGITINKWYKIHYTWNSIRKGVRFKGDNNRTVSYCHKSWRGKISNYYKINLKFNK
jgi:hypothetical protein